MDIKSKPVSSCFLQAPEWNVLRDIREIERRNKGGRRRKKRQMRSWGDGSVVRSICFASMGARVQILSTAPTLKKKKAGSWVSEMMAMQVVETGKWLGLNCQPI